MTNKVDKYKKPVSLEDAKDPYLEDYKYYINYGVPFSPDKSVRDRGASLDDAMLFIDMLLHQYEAYYEQHDIDKNLVVFPNLFKMPDEGTKIRNKKTGEIYTIQDVIVNPYTKQWEGLVRISSVTPPNPNLVEKLEFVDQEKARVRFTHEYPVSLESEGQTSDGLISDAGPIPPCVVWALIRKEPGSIGKAPFHPSKEYKPRRRELLRNINNPGHVQEVRGQWFDNLVQFDCWTTDNFSAERLANWFEKFMTLYDWVLKLNGVQEMLYWQRLRDASVTKWRQDLVSRTVQYFFRTEVLEAVVQKTFVDIELSASVAPRISDDLAEKFIAGRLVKISGLTYKQYKDLFRNSDGKYLFGNTTLNDS